MSLQPLDPSNYTKDYNFKSLKPPNLDHIVNNELPTSSSDWIGYTDKKELLCSLSTTDAWSSFTTELVNTIKSYLDQAIPTNKSKTGKVLLLKKIQKTLAEKEEALIEAFVFKNTVVSLGSYFENAERRGAIGVLARRMIDMVKHDMCSQSSKFATEITSLIRMSFAESNIIACYKQCMLPTIYYIAGWHIATCLKMSKKRKGKLGDAMIYLFEYATVERNTGIELDYCSKVKKNEMFGGLHFVSENFFHFVLRLEYVFVNCLTPVKLAVLGNRLMMHVHDKLNECNALRDDIINMIGEDTEENVVSELISHLVRTYCRMRGKDFCRQLMATDFTNLGKGVRPTMAVLSDKKTYKSMKIHDTSNGNKNKDNAEYHNFNNLAENFTTDENENDHDNTTI